MSEKQIEIAFDGFLTPSRGDAQEQRLSISGKVEIPEPPSSGPKPFPWLEIAGKAGIIVGLVGAWLLLVGWLFAYYYFEKFGIGVAALELDRKVLPLYGFLTLIACWWVPVLVILACGGLIFMLRRLKILLPPSTIITLVAVALFAVFSCGYWMAGANASKQYAEMVNRDYPGYRNIQVWTQGHWQQGDLKPIADALKSPNACFRLIYANEKALYLFKPIRGQTALEPPVLVIARNGKEISTFRTRATETSCSH